MLSLRGVCYQSPSRFAVDSVRIETRHEKAEGNVDGSRAMTVSGDPVVESMRSARLATLRDAQSDRLHWMRGMGIDGRTAKRQGLDRPMSDEVWIVRTNAALRDKRRMQRRKRRRAGSGVREADSASTGLG